MIGTAIAIPGQTAAMGGFSPQNVGGLLLWLRADLGITLNGSNVSAWADQSGNGYSELQGIGAKQPPWSASSFNGRPGVSFTGSQGLQTGTNVNYGGTNKITVFVVATGSVAALGEILESSASVGTVAGAWNLVADANAASDLQFTTNGDGSHVGTPFFVPGAPFASPSQLNCIYDLTTTGTQASVRFNGGAASLTAGGTNAVGTFTNQQLNIGARSNGGSLFWTGTMAEVVIYNRALSASEIVRVEKYIGAFWGVPS